MMQHPVKKPVPIFITIMCFIVLSCCMGLQSMTLAQTPCVTVTEDQSVANKFTRHTVTGITTPLPVEPDVTGFIGASYLTVADIDEDGVDEIIASSGVGPDSDLATSNGEVALFTWDGSDLGVWSQVVLNNTFTFPNETEAKDIDLDGDLDIVVADHFIANNDPGGLYYLENAGGDITDPLNWTKQTIYEDTTPDSYHRTYFIDLDGDSDEDIITMNFSSWTGWCKNNGGGSYSTHTIGTGGGSLFAMFDVDQDGDLDIVTPQFSITTSLFNCVVLGGPGGSDPLGDSLIWFENPGQTTLASNPDTLWNRYTIDNWYTSSNPIGKGLEVVVSDIDNDGTDEFVVSNHNHQNKDGGGNRIWPSGIYYFEIPGTGDTIGDPKVTSDWVPISIETGDPNFVYDSGANARTDPYNDPAVWADAYAVDRRGSFFDQGSPGMVRAGNVNEDALEDLVVPGDGKGRLYYYEAAEPTGGCLTFKRATLYEYLQCMPGEAEIVDLDRDGDMDIVAAIFDTSVTNPYPYTSSSIFVYENVVTLIDLASFTAHSGSRKVELTWVTESETDNAGFNLYRSVSEDGNYVKINNTVIAAQGTPAKGMSYTYVDDDVQNRTTYYYKLEDVDLNGTATMHGPVSATPRLVY